MEEGGEIKLCYNECNRDHLATVKDSLETKKKNNNSQWLVSGFNGFGQFKFENQRKLHQLEEFQLPLNSENSKVLVACSWNCLAVSCACSLHLEGFISNNPKTVKSFNTKVPIKSLDICDLFCLVLLENGKVYKFVLKYEEELKEITFQTCLTPVAPQKRTIFGECKTSDETILEIAHIACGNNIVAAISTMNAVFSGTSQIFQFPKHQRIKQLKCGLEHALLLTKNGDVYSWGNGLRGQLGLEILRIEEAPTLIEALAGIKIIYIAASGWHSAAISIFGDLYTWGFNLNGQLGLRIYKTSAKTIKEPTVYPQPQLLDLSLCQCIRNPSEGEEATCYPLKVVAGGRHTVVQMNCGAIYAAGWNAYGQLGLTNALEYCDNFEFVLKLNNDNTLLEENQIICGNWCTLISK